MNDLREIWREFPPWLKTFVIGLVLAIAGPTLTALESVDTATDWRVWAGALSSAVALSVAHYLKDRLRITLAEAMAGGGLLVAAGAFGAGYMAAPAAQQAGVDPPLVDTGDTIKVIAREPGVAFDVLLFCNDKTTTVGKTPMTDAPAGGDRYIALRGTESVNWANSPPERNPSAMHYVTAPDGRQNGEAVEVSKAAADCLKKKAK